jgi:hypothetical protein
MSPLFSENSQMMTAAFDQQSISMSGLTFKCWGENVYIPLSEVLLALGHRVLKLKWKVEIAELAPGARTAALEKLGVQQRVGTLELLHHITPSVQIIDGEFSAYEPGGRLKLIVRAVDSTWWDIETSDPKILKVVQEQFPDAVPLPETGPRPKA